MLPDEGGGDGLGRPTESLCAAKCLPSSSWTVPQCASPTELPVPSHSTSLLSLVDKSLQNSFSLPSRELRPESCLAGIHKCTGSSVNAGLCSVPRAPQHFLSLNVSSDRLHQRSCRETSYLPVTVTPIYASIQTMDRI